MATSQLAAQLYTLRDFMKTPADIATTFKKVKTIGYNAVQLSGLGPIAPQELADILTGEGLQAIITHTGFPRLQNELDAVIAEHKLWNCPNLAIGSMPGEFRSPEGIMKFAAFSNEVGKKLADAGLTFSYHNHSFEFAKDENGVTWLDNLYNNADPRYLQAELDTYWVQHGGADPVAWIEKMSGRMPVIHFKDMVIVGEQQAMAEVGEGNLNWARIIPACHAAGVQWIAVEQDVCRRDPFDCLATSYQNLVLMGV